MNTVRLSLLGPTMLRATLLCPTVLCLTMAACQSSPAALPESHGRGLVRADESPPADVATYERPTWREGDRFSMVRGEQLRGTYEVTSTDGDVYSIDDGSGRLLRRDLDLGNLGRWSPDEEPLRIMAPVDVRYHWPLWVGKSWQCEFVDQAPGGPALTMSASYVVEGLDQVRVPAGEFEALRIVRTLRLAGGVEGKYLTRTQVTWYAPEPGLEVRHLLGDTMVELVDHSRK